MVPLLSVCIIGLNMLLGLLIPLGLFVYMKGKYQLPVKSFLLGILVMLFFALIMEQGVHAVVLSSDAGAKIQASPWLMALYGGLMAALFEESGRFLAMRFLMKKQHADPHNALLYGAGHGGLEVMMILLLGMINNLVYSVMFNAGRLETLVAPLDEASKTIVYTGVNTLITTPSWQFLMAPIERIAALILQISLSVLVWTAVCDKKIKWQFFILAFLIHMIVDASSALLNRLGMSILLIEIFIWIMALATAIFAKHIWNTILEKTDQ